MRIGIVGLLLMMLLISPLSFSNTAAAEAPEPPRVSIIANSVDRMTAELILIPVLNATGLSYEIIGPEGFENALRRSDVIIVLGGPMAYEGVGNISKRYIPPSNASTLIEEPETFLIAVYRGARDVIVIAGHTREETRAATGYFLRDRGIVSITKLHGWLPMPLDFRNGSRAVYDISKLAGKLKAAAGNVKFEAKAVRVNGTEYLNLSTVEIDLTGIVNRTSLSYFLIREIPELEGYGIPEDCRLIVYEGGNLTGDVRGCPRADRERPGDLRVYVTFKLGGQGLWDTGHWLINRTILYSLGNVRVRAALVLKYVFSYPEWKVLPSFSFMYVNPSAVPFGGMVVRWDLEVRDGKFEPKRILELGSFRP